MNIYNLVNVYSPGYFKQLQKLNNYFKIPDKVEYIKSSKKILVICL